MKPIFILGATMLSASAAFGFALVLERQGLAQSPASPDRIVPVERIVRPSISWVNPQSLQSVDRNGSADFSGLQENPVVPQIAAQSEKSVLESEAPDISTSSETGQIVAFGHADLSSQPPLYFLESGEKDSPAGSTGTVSPIAKPELSRVERFETISFIGVYR